MRIGYDTFVGAQSMGDLARSRVAGLNHGIISIGPDCDPRLYLRQPLGLSKAKGYLSCPFDLGYSTENAVLSHFRNRFTDFFDGLHMLDECPVACRTCPTPFRRNMLRVGIIANGSGVVFEHESPTHATLFPDGRNDTEYYSRNGFERLIARYTRRIENLYKVIEDNSHVVLVRGDPRSDFSSFLRFAPSAARELEGILRSQYPDKTFKVLSIPELLPYLQARGATPG